MRKLILMTSAAVIAPLSCFAEDITCTATPNCADLGYTSTTSCDNGVKCPWGEAWFCPPSPPEVCEIGSILYSDMTCYKEAQTGKTPIGVVIYVDGLGGGQAMALDSIGRYTWGGYGTDISGLTNYSSTSTASKDYASCENSKIIMAAGFAGAIRVVHEYSTEGTEAGDWCLPAAGIFTSIKNNQSVINNGFSRAGGKQFISSTYAWSSSEYTSNYAWSSKLTAGNGLSYNSKGNYYEVRPVLEFTQTFEGVCKGTFKYTCKGENETGGIGEACSGRYEKCTCTEGYKWNGEKCKFYPWGKCTGIAANCALGDILFSDGTCSVNTVLGKTPIAVVVYKSDDGKCGQAMALKSLSGTYAWDGYGSDISGLPNYTSNSTAATDYASCENSEIIMAAGDKSIYPAVWAAHGYSTEGTSVGDWCLPAAGIFTSYQKNQTSVNTGFDRANGIPYTIIPCWSSSEYDDSLAWYLYMEGSYGLSINSRNTKIYVCPVIEF